MYRYAGNFGEIERISLSCYTTFAPMTRQTGRTKVALSAHLTTKLPVLYQHMKGKAHGYFINSQTFCSC